MKKIEYLKWFFHLIWSCIMLNPITTWFRERRALKYERESMDEAHALGGFMYIIHQNNKTKKLREFGYENEEIIDILGL